MTTMPPHHRPVDPPGVAARRAALRLLDAVERRGETVDHAAGAATRDLSPPDRAMALAIVGETLRWSVDLNRLIDGATQRPLPPDAKARAVLRLALAQWLRMGTPVHAVVATMLPLLTGGPRRLVHGVLGTVTRGGAVLPAAPTLPPAVGARWHAQWGAAMVDAAAAALAAPPPLDLTLARDDPAGTIARSLDGIALVPWQIRVPRRGPVEALPGFTDGAWWVQDLAASLPARLLGSGRGRALDLCAAPGGKALQLAAAGWRVTALDRSAARMRRLTDNVTRTGLTIAERVVADLTTWTPAAPFDAILIDAPCSATGTFRRHPEVLLRDPGPHLSALIALQRIALARAARWLGPQGRIVYAVCSLEQAEGEDHLPHLDTLGLTVDPIDPAECPAGIAPRADGTLRVLPGAIPDYGGLDGFFIARLRAA